MGAYQVGRMVWEISREPALAEQFRRDSEALMERFRLTEEEKQAIRNKDIRFLYELGVNPYQIIGPVPRLFGMSQAEMIAAIADAPPHPECPTTDFPGPLRDPQGRLRVVRQEYPLEQKDR